MLYGEEKTISGIFDNISKPHVGRVSKSALMVLLTTAMTTSLSLAPTGTRFDKFGLISAASAQVLGPSAGCDFVNAGLANVFVEQPNDGDAIIQISVPQNFGGNDFDAGDLITVTVTLVDGSPGPLTGANDVTSEATVLIPGANIVGNFSASGSVSGAVRRVGENSSVPLQATINLRAGPNGGSVRIVYTCSPFLLPPPPDPPPDPPPPPPEPGENEAELRARIARQVAQINGFATQIVPGAFNPNAFGQLGIPAFRPAGNFPDLGIVEPAAPDPAVKACLNEIAFLEQQLNIIDAEIAALLAERPDESDVTDEDLRGEEGFENFIALDLQLAAGQTTVSALQNDLASARRSLRQLRSNGGVNVELSAENAAKFASDNPLLGSRGVQNDARKSGNRGDAVVDVALILTGAAAAKLIGKAVSGFQGSARFATESTGRILKGIADKGVERATAIARAEARAQRLARDAFRKQTRNAIAEIPTNIVNASDNVVQAADEVLEAADSLANLPKATNFFDNAAAAAADPKKEAQIRELIRGQERALENKNRAVQEVLDVFTSNQAALNAVNLTDELTNAGVGLLGVNGLLSVLADSLLGGAITLGSVLRAEEIKLVNVLNVLEPELEKIRAEAGAARDSLVRAALERKRAAHLQQVDVLRADRQTIVERLARLKVECEDLQANNYVSVQHQNRAAHTAIGSAIREPRRINSYRSSFILSDYRRKFALGNQVYGLEEASSLPGVLADGRFNFWITPSITFHNDQTANDVEGLSLSVGTGVSWQIHENVNVGLSAQLGISDLDNNPINQIESETLTLGLFSQAVIYQDLQLSTLAAYTVSNIDSINDGVSGSSTTNAFTGQAALSNSFELGTITISPSLGATYVHIEQDGFFDSLGTFNPSTTTDQLSASFGGSIARQFLLADDQIKFTPSVSINGFVSTTELSSSALAAVGQDGKNTNTGLTLSGGFGLSHKQYGFDLSLSGSVTGLTKNAQTYSIGGRFTLPF